MPELKYPLRAFDLPEDNLLMEKVAKIKEIAEKLVQSKAMFKRLYSLRYEAATVPEEYINPTLSFKISKSFARELLIRGLESNMTEITQEIESLQNQLNSLTLNTCITKHETD